MSIAVVAGNPKPKSRTLAAGVLLAQTLTGAAPDLVIDVIDLGPGLLGWGDPAVAEAVAAVRESDVLIVASPTFKATYTGVLKLFLDQIPSDGLAGVHALPLMLGAGPGHALAPELLLKPVLAELGAITPARGLYLLDTTYADDPQLAAYADRVRPLLPLEQGE
ncbi:NADPH-dependent FMN reductase [Catenuloplanes atrovinosus]|uniref:FMN reductase n=1 Tax=Catenuloplanes atrovinosus TaxID=137266 RepID=A0AAE3YSE2_9ACTN|nr:NAD(P)H-dependent oxidoreductase [Catenuloplanes atrovinosus]MDR7279098.1 FMN reductase [Catenuloplanes atrovinosus]